MSFLSKQRWLIALMLLVLVPTGFFTKFYSGPAQVWISNSAGGLLYEIFWCLSFYFLFPKSKPIILSVIVFISTCLLEFLQLLHSPFLEDIRSNFIGRTIIGNAFNWMDFPYYVAGSFLGYLILKFISKIPEK
jgi:hypothetical protein